MDQSRSDSIETQKLLEASQGGAPRAFDRLFGLHRGYLKKIITLRLDPRLTKRLDASDLVQETQMEAFRRLPNYLRERPVPVRLWLRQIAYDQIRNARRQHLRTAGRQVTREVPLPEDSAVHLALLASSSNPSDRAVRRERARLVREAIGRLSPRHSYFKLQNLLTSSSSSWSSSEVIMTSSLVVLGRGCTIRYSFLSNALLYGYTASESCCKMKNLKRSQRRGYRELWS